MFNSLKNLLLSTEFPERSLMPKQHQGKDLLLQTMDNGIALVFSQ
jgi:hypothetical protein